MRQEDVAFTDVVVREEIKISQVGHNLSVVTFCATIFLVLIPVLGNNCPHCTINVYYYREFTRGKFQFPRAAPSSQSVKSVTPRNIEAVRKMLQQLRRLTYYQAEVTLDISAPGTHTVLNEHLHVRQTLVTHSLLIGTKEHIENGAV